MSVVPDTEARLSTRVGVLGAFRICIDGVEVAGMAKMSRRIATVLAGWPGIRVDRERMVAAIWNGDVPVDVVNSLQGHVSVLRRSIGRDLVDTDADGYVLRVPAEAVDAEAFIPLVEQARRSVENGEPVRALPMLVQAREMWRGSPYREVFDPDLVARRARLEETYEQVRELIVECRLALAQTPSAASELVAWAKEEVIRAPEREQRHVLLVRALSAANRPAEALQAYRRAEAALLQHCDSKPGPQLLAAFPGNAAPTAAGPSN